jgi:undecaprenyl-diphosphatase
MRSQLDVDLLHRLNGLDARNPSADKLMHVLCDDLFLRGAPLLLFFWLTWFASRKRSGSAAQDGRARMLCGIAATCALTLLSVTLQSHLNVHVRPVLDPSLGVRVDSGTALSDWIGLGHLNSFPSDTTAMYCGLAMTIGLINRRMGLAALVWTIVVIGIPRIYFGYHFPSDVLFGAIMGVAGPALVASSEVVRRWAANGLELFRSREPLLNALMFLFIFDMANLFMGMRYLAHGFRKLMTMAI